MQPGQTCAVTGATGFLGGKICAHLQAAGIDTVSMSRTQPAGDAAHIPFSLDREVDPADLRAQQVGALVHCAYDFKQRSMEDIERVNVAGSRKLFKAARGAGVDTIIYLSSMSAFDGCRSKYGRGKLRLEPDVLGVGGGCSPARTCLRYDPGRHVQRPAEGH